VPCSVQHHRYNQKSYAAPRLSRRPKEMKIRFSASLECFSLYKLTKFDGTAALQLTAKNLTR